MLLPILYQDEQLIAVHKPAGLLVHPNWATPRHTPHLMGLLAEQLSIPLFTLHRLDRATSGVILLAKDKHTTLQMNAQFAAQQVHKTYQCVARGFVPEQGMIDHPLKPIFDKKIDHPDSDRDKPPKPAQTAYRRLAQLELPIPVGRYPSARYSWLEVKPATGRKHQIRRHLKHIFHPLIGDTRYGEGRHNRLFREQFNCHRLLLMATELGFTHPLTGQQVVIRAPLGDDVQALFTQLDWCSDSGAHAVD